jgi:hypothetical protein
LTGSKSWAESGTQEHAAGETEYDAARAKGYAEGTKDRISGKKDTIVGAITGDREQEVTGVYHSVFYGSVGVNKVTGNIQKDKGQAQQDLNRPT